MREGLEVAGLLEKGAAHHGRKAHDLSVGVAELRDGSLQPVYDTLEERASRLHAVRGRRLQQCVDHRLDSLRGNLGGRHMAGQSRSVDGTSKSNSDPAAPASSRSLLIMIDDDNTSRRLRAM